LLNTTIYLNFYKLNKYIKFKKINKKINNYLYKIINNYYYLKMQGKTLMYIFNSENYIKLILASHKGSKLITNIFLKNWFFLKINN